jgi:hypothetical protein
MFNGHMPDLYAIKSSSRIITEVETCDTISTDHTRDQYSAFSRVPLTEFHVKTPASCVSIAQAYASLWKIRVDKWWTEAGY